MMFFVGEIGKIEKFFMEQITMSQEKHIIKKYPNRRLYDTVISGYVTLEDLKEMVMNFEEIQVVDVKTGEDLTRQVLLQILLTEEVGSTPLLSNEMLCQMIQTYGQASHSVFAPFLEQNMKIFADWQRQIRAQKRTLSRANRWFADPFSLPSNNMTYFAEWQKSLQEAASNFWGSINSTLKNRS